MRKRCLRKQKGNIGELMITGICILAMTVTMLSYMEHVSLLQEKAEVVQLARKYILKMETEGYLSTGELALLTNELEAIGITEINCAGTTVNKVTYGESIVLQIQGKLRGEYAFVEKRVSTAKN